MCTYVDDLYAFNTRIKQFHHNFHFFEDLNLAQLKAEPEKYLRPLGSKFFCDILI